MGLVVSCGSCVARPVSNELQSAKALYLLTCIPPKVRAEGRGDRMSEGGTGPVLTMSALSEVALGHTLATFGAVPTVHTDDDYEVCVWTHRDAAHAYRRKRRGHTPR